MIVLSNSANTKTKKIRKINEKGQFLPYYGYTIAAMIHSDWLNRAKKIENFIRNSHSRRSFVALPADTYHMSIYNIYSNGNQLIPPINRWLQKSTRRSIPNRGWLPNEVLDEANKKALCILWKYLNEPLKIKYATLNIGTTALTLSLELQEESLQRIIKARNGLKKKL